jgi:hypothetical protein
MLPDKINWAVWKDNKLEHEEALVWNEQKWHHVAGLEWCQVLDTELLHLCWLVEETLSSNQFGDYSVNLLCDDIHATWQQRVIALAKVKGVELLRPNDNFTEVK